MRHATNNTGSGSQMPLLPTSFSLADDARSMGTRSTMLAGRNSAKNIGTRRYAGVVRKGRKCLKTKSTTPLRKTRANPAKTSLPTADPASKVVSMAEEEAVIRLSVHRFRNFVKVGIYQLCLVHGCERDAALTVLVISHAALPIHLTLVI